MSAEGPYHCELCDVVYVVPALARSCENKHLAETTEPRPSEEDRGSEVERLN